MAVIDINHTGFGDLAISDEYGKVHLFLHDPKLKPGEMPRFQPGIELPSMETSASGWFASSIGTTMDGMT